MIKKPLSPNIVACVWDFDKALIPGYMQEPIFATYGIGKDHFWEEVNALPTIPQKELL